MISIYTSQLVWLCALMGVVGLGMGVILSNLIDAWLAARKRPMATPLPAPRVDCVVRADPYYTSPGRGRA